RVAPLLKNVTLGELKVTWEARKSILAPVPSSFVYRLTLPDKAVLELGSGRISGIKPEGPVNLIVEVDDGSGYKPVGNFSADGKKWQEHEVSLHAYSGRKVSLRFRSEGPVGAPAVIGNPIVRTHAATG